MSRIDLSGAVAAGVLTWGEASIIGRCIVDHGGAIELRRHNLSDDMLEALDRAIIWMQDQERATTAECSGR